MGIGADDTCDASFKVKLIRSLLRDYVCGVNHPFLDPSDLSYVVTTVKNFKLLRDPHKQETYGWKAAVDSWDRQVLTLMDSSRKNECRAGISLLAVTCQECIEKRFLASYSLWINKLLRHIQLSESSQCVDEGAFVALSDIFIRLSRYPNAKDHTSLATKVVEPTLKSLKNDTSGDEEALGLIHTLMKFCPESIHRHLDGVEAAIFSKILSGKCSANVIEKLSHLLPLILKSRGSKDRWLLMLEKILLSIHRLLSDAFQGLGEGTEFPPSVTGLAVSGLTCNLPTRKPERLLGSKICALMSCCCIMLTSFFQVQVIVPIRGLLALATRVLLVNNSLLETPSSLMTTLKHEYVCSELPRLQLHALEIITAIIKGSGSQIARYFTEIVQLVTNYMRRCTLPELRKRAYTIIRVLLMSMRAGVQIHVIQDIISVLFVDLNPHDYRNDNKCSNATLDAPANSGRKRKKCSRMTGSFQEQPAKDGLEIGMSRNFIPISVKTAALEVLEALLMGGDSFKSEIWRSDVDHLITAATNACNEGWSCEPSSAWADFQLASLRTLLASLLSRGRIHPSHIASSHELFVSGLQERGTKIADFCGIALLAMNELRRPKTISPLDTDSSRNDHNSLDHNFSEAESLEDDLNENWIGIDDDGETETQVPEKQTSANDAANPPATVPEEKDLAARTSSPDEEIVVGGSDSTVERLMPRNSKKQKPDSEPRMSANLPVPAHESAAIKPVGSGTTMGSDLSSSRTGHHTVEMNDKVSSILERMSDTLARTDRSGGLIFEQDSEFADSIPDIMDGDPDSD